VDRDRERSGSILGRRDVEMESLDPTENRTGRKAVMPNCVVQPRAVIQDRRGDRKGRSLYQAVFPRKGMTQGEGRPESPGRQQKRGESMG